MVVYKSIFDGGELRSELENAGIHPLNLEQLRLGRHPSLPSAAYLILNSKFMPLTSSVHSVDESVDGVTSKLLIKLQVGCKMGCKFCATGSMGFKNNLSAGEIVEQLVHASSISSIRNIVFMIIHAINKLRCDLPNLNLAVSLHAPVQDICCQIMPSARAFPLEKLMDTLRLYLKNSQQKIFTEYIMLDGINDEEQHTHQLGKLLETFDVVINLIPLNPIGDLSQFRTSSESKVLSFQRILHIQHQNDGSQADGPGHKWSLWPAGGEPAEEEM